MNRFRIAAVIALLAIGIAWLAFRDLEERRAERSTAERDTVAELDDLAPDVLEQPSAPPPATETSELPVAEYSPEDPVGIVVYGAVRAPDGTPLAESSILARSEEGASRISMVADGSFAITGLRPGTWTLRCYAEGIGYVEHTMVLAESLALVRLDLQLEASTLILVRFVCPDGTPLGERLSERQLSLFSLPILAVATQEPPGAILPTFRHRPRLRFGLGEFRHRVLRGVPNEKGYDGVLETATPPPYSASAVFRDTVLDTVPVQLGDDEVVFTIAIEQILAHLCTIRARFVDAETGAPLAGAGVRLSDQVTAGRMPRVDEDGSWVVHRKAYGSYELQVHSTAHESFSLVFSARAPETDLGEVRIDPATTVEGKVIDEVGNPIACALTWLHLDRFESRWAAYFDGECSSGRSEPDGTFGIPRLGRGRYLISPGEPYACTATRVDTRGGSVEGLAVRVSAGVDVRIDTGAEPAASLPVRVDDDRDLPVRTLWASGPFTIRLAPGRYTVRVDDGARVRSATFTVGSEPLEVTVAP